LALGALIGLIYCAGLSGIVYYTEMRDRQNDSLVLDLEAEKLSRAQLQGLVNEIVQDNQDLRVLAGRRAQPQPYPATVDPSDDPRGAR
jgi:hypothetical protein